MELAKYGSLKQALKNFGSLPMYCLWKWKTIRKLLIWFWQSSAIIEASHMIIELQKQNSLWPRN
jgi:hypothetical protein